MKCYSLELAGEMHVYRVCVCVFTIPSKRKVQKKKMEIVFVSGEWSAQSEQLRNKLYENESCAIPSHFPVSDDI